MSENVTVEDTIGWVDRYQQFVQLASLLPPASDKPVLVRCKRCGADLGCVSNSRGVALGRFERQDREWSRLTSASVFSDRRLPLRCATCGTMNRWTRTRDR